MSIVKCSSWRGGLSGFVLLISILVVLNCQVQEVGDPLSATQFKTSQNVTLFGSTGLEKTTFHTYENVFLSLQDLFANYQTDIQIVRLSDKQTVQRLVVITNEAGELNKLPIWYHVGVDENCNTVDESGDYVVHVQQHSDTEPWHNLTLPFNVKNAVGATPLVIATKDDGSVAGGCVLVGENVFASGLGFASGEVRLNVVEHHQLKVDDPIIDVSGAVEVVIVGGDGTIPNTAIWQGATVGAFDIVADIAPFGVFNDGDVVSEGLLTGLTVQNPGGTDDIIADIACDELGHYKNTFADLEAVYAAIDPSQQPDSGKGSVAIYVVAHQDVWGAGDLLVGIETAGSMSMPTVCLANPCSGSLNLTQIRALAKEGYRTPLKLWPGNYDVIIDVNKNGVYDPGTDILDGGSQVGFNVPGTPPEIRLIGSANTDLFCRSTLQTRLLAQLVNSDGSPVVGANVGFSIPKGPGALDVESAVTNENGVAFVIYSGADYGKEVIIRIVVTIDGKEYVYIFSLWKCVPFTHNQGVIGG